MLVQAATGHQLVDKKEAAAAVAPTQELHEVTVLEPADDSHLCLELLPPLRRRLRREHLDRHRAVFLATSSDELPTVDATEATAAELPVVGKVVGGHG